MLKALQKKSLKKGQNYAKYYSNYARFCKIMPSINAKCQEAQNYAKKHNYAKYGNIVSTPNDGTPLH